MYSQTNHANKIPMGIPMAQPINSVNPNHPNRFTSKDNAFKSVQADFDKAYDLLDKRLRNINNKRQNYYNAQNNPYNPLYANKYQYLQQQEYNRLQSNYRGELISPNLYDYQNMEPIYYPLEMPLCGEPVALPNMEVGMPSQKRNNINIGLKEIAQLIEQIGDEEYLQLPPNNMEVMDYDEYKKNYNKHHKKEKKKETKSKKDKKEKYTTDNNENTQQNSEV